MTYREVQLKIGELVTKTDATVADYVALLGASAALESPVPSFVRRLKVAFLGSFTLQSLPEVTAARGVFHNLLLATYLAPYNQFSQEILEPASELYALQPQLIYLLVDYCDLLSPEHLDELVVTLKERTTAHIAVANFTAGPKVEAAEVASANGSLAKRWQNDSRVHVFDFDAFVSAVGREKSWYTKYAKLGDLRLSPQAFPELAERLLSLAVGAAGATKKCLVLDLDNTLWQGIVGEDGVDGIKPDIRLQTFIKQLYDRGIVLAINSKNNLDDALEVFAKRTDMVLKLEHFAAWRINWTQKASNMAELAEELNLGLDSFAYVDDEPMNLGLVRMSFPEVASLLPSQLYDYAGFRAFTLTDEDKRRGAMYAEERQRREVKVSARNPEEYLRQLKLRVNIFPADETQVARLSQLTQKTNQFNLTTRRYSEERLREIMATGWKVWGISAQDVFGDYGTIGVAILCDDGEVSVLDSFLLSCRVLGRGIEQVFLGHILSQARGQGFKELNAEFIPTPKNKPAAGFLKQSGFGLIGDNGGAESYRYDLGRDFPLPDYITVNTQ